MNRLTANGLLLGSAVIWGIAFLFQQSAMSHMQPCQFLAARSIVAALALAPLAWLELKRTDGASEAPLPDLVRTGLIGGAMFFIAGALQQYGLLTATVTNTGFLTGLYVVITPLLLWLWLRRSPSTLVWSAVAMAFAGTWALGGGSVGGFSFGDGLVAIGAIFWAIHLLVTDAGPVKLRPITFTCLQFTVVAALSLVIGLLIEPTGNVDVVAAMPAILYVGLLSSALTFTLLAVAMRHTPPAEASILVSTESVFAAAAAAVVLGERLTPVGLVGATLMFSATVLVQIAPLFERPRPT